MFRKNILYLVVILIGALLVTDIILTNRNNEIIQHNKGIQEETSRIKDNYDLIGQLVIHSLDIGLRGYAIVRTPQFVAPLENGSRIKDSMMVTVASSLEKLHYDFSQFNVFKDSLDSYTKYCLYLRQLLQHGEEEKFKGYFASDKGAHLYWQYLECQKHINAFLGRLDQDAQRRYEDALSRNQILQVALFLLCFPTLLITAFYTSRSFRLSEMLIKAEEDKIKILTGQNLVLEKKVAERTQELATQNEEITSQSEELAAQRDALAVQNRQLQDAQKIIELQNLQIHSKNQQLEAEVTNRTQELQNTNKELLDHNSQLEQFAFIAAHNLRAPLARILGLANIIQISSTTDEKSAALEKLLASTKDLDHVIRDLNTILDIRKHTSNLTEVDLEQTFRRVLKMLEREVEETRANIVYHFNAAPTVYAVAPYVESMFFNLLSNALKYRNPEVQLIVRITSAVEGSYVLVSFHDNGLGIDLSKYGNQVFSLYKRFHLHVEGKGLGLYLIKTQITSLGGKVQVESQPFKGTTFRLFFRQAEP
jgi:signal transduction histidine kinase